MGWTLNLAVLLTAGLLTFTTAAALPICNSPVVTIPSADKLVFAVIGDWGRVGAEDSLFNEETVESCASLGQCCSALQQPNFRDDFDYPDVLDSRQQRYTATLLNEVCGEADCRFVVGVGDNFYPCGADSVESGLDRFQTTWNDVYHSEEVPNIAGLTWYQILGNHDYAFQNSVGRQVNYSTTDDRWVLPAPYYAKTFVAGDVSLDLMFLDETPFIGNYVYPRPSTAYFNPYLASQVTPDIINSDAADFVNQTSELCLIPPENATFITNTSANASGQIPWLKSCLQTGSSTWSAMVGHYALYGSDVNWAQLSKKSEYPGNCGAFGSLVHLLDTFNVDAYFNGHDHTQTHADPKKLSVPMGEADTYGKVSYLVSKEGNVSSAATQYFTLGNGASVEWGDGVTLNYPKSYNDFSDVVYNSNVQYANGTVSDAGMEAAVGEGFAIVTVDTCIFQVQFYSIINYEPEEDAQPVHTAVIQKC